MRTSTFYLDHDQSDQDSIETTYLSKGEYSMRKLSKTCDSVSLGPSGLFILDENHPTDSFIDEERADHSSSKHEERDDNERTPSEKILPSRSLVHINPDARKMRAPTQLRTLLQVMSSEKLSSHRTNACGALKTLCFVKQNRIRLAFTQGVIPVLVNMATNKNSTEIEKTRCLQSLIYLSLENCNHELFFRDSNVCNKLAELLLINISRISQMASYCISLLAEDNINRHRIVQNECMMKALLSAIQREAFTNRPQKSEESNVTVLEYDPMITSVRINTLTTFLHISKVRDLTVDLCREKHFVSSLLKYGILARPTYELSLSIIANLTRSPENSLFLVNQVNGIIPALVKAIGAKSAIVREFACYAIQNLSCCGKCRVSLCSSSELISSLSSCISRERYPREQMSAMKSIKNLLQNPSIFVHFMEADGPMKYLIKYLDAAQKKKSNKANEFDFVSRDVVATISHWITMSALEGLEDKSSILRNETILIEPTLAVVDWNMWK